MSCWIFLATGLIAGMWMERLGARWKSKPFDAARDQMTALWIEATSVGVAIIVLIMLGLYLIVGGNR
jgi:hypothetical protein